MKKSTRKVTLEAQNKFTVFIKEFIKHDIVLALEKKFKVTIRLNNLQMAVIKGDKIGSEKLQELFLKLSKLRRDIQLEDLQDILDGKEVDFSEPIDNEPKSFKLDFLDKNGKTNLITPKTANQKLFIEKMLANPVCLGMGSAGSGKSSLAIAVALKLLELKKINQIIVSKPPIETGPTIGLLPGTLEEKISIFYNSVIDILTEIIGKEKTERLLKYGTVKIEHVGFLRGTTLGGKNNATFILVDEAQNLDFQQSKLILSRLGDNKESRLVLTGDQRQSDLKYNKDNLSIIYNIIKDSPHVGSVTFNKSDIVRSIICRDLMERVEDYEDAQNEKRILK